MTITTTREKISFRCVFSCFFVYIHTSVSAYEVRDAMCLRSLFAFGNWIWYFFFLPFLSFFQNFSLFFFLFEIGERSATDRPVAGERKATTKEAHKRAKERGFVPPSIVVQKNFFFKQQRERRRSTNGEVSVLSSRESRFYHVTLLLLLLFYPFLEIRHRSSTHARTHQRERKGNSLVRIHSNALNEAIGCGTFETRTHAHTRNTCSEKSGKKRSFFLYSDSEKKGEKKR